MDAKTDQNNVSYMKLRKLRHPNHFTPFMGAKEDFLSKEGVKLDSSKPKISLIPSEAINEMAIAFTYGANKYAADNFKGGIAYRRLLDAAFRHLLAISNGEDVDSESGNSHVGHAMASLAMLCYMMKNKPQFDDRYKDK